MSRYTAHYLPAAAAGITADAAITLGALTAAADGAVAIQGDASSTLGTLILAADGSLAVQGAAGITLGALLHMAVTLGLMPTTGLAFPFMSYGRSGLIMALFSVGVLVNIGRSRHSAPGTRSSAAR